jgi:hypothetical protein
MLRIVIKRFNGQPVIREDKVILIDERLEEIINEEIDLSNVGDMPGFRQRQIELAARRVANFNYEEEETAKRDKSRPKRRIRKLIISSIN